jgi:hypothetical protein
MRRIRSGRGRDGGYTRRWTSAVSGSAKQGSVLDATDCIIRRHVGRSAHGMHQTSPPHRPTTARPAAADTRSHPSGSRAGGSRATADAATSATRIVGATGRVEAAALRGRQVGTLARHCRASLRQFGGDPPKHGPLSPERARMVQRPRVPLRDRQRREHHRWSGLRRFTVEAADLRRALPERERTLFRHVAIQQLLQ